MADGAKLIVDTRPFKRSLEAWLRSFTRQEIPRVFQKAVFDLLSDILFNAPVDTGRSRAGWYAYLDSHGLPYAVKGNDPDAIEEGRELGEAYEKISEYELEVTLINNVNYVLYIELREGFIRMVLDQHTDALVEAMEGVAGGN